MQVIPIFDVSGTLADLFLPLSTTEQSLGDVPIGTGLPVHPSTDLTGRPDLDEQNVGLERIGVNGARHQFAVPPGFDVGLEHTITTPALDIEGAPVSASPIVWIGRRAALTSSAVVASRFARSIHSRLNTEYGDCDGNSASTRDLNFG